jgi:nitrite reductase/ring-hydroxylating ferredoxin subunit
VSGVTWIASDLPPIIRDGTEYFLLVHDDALYLVDSRCPHRGGMLKYGFVNGRNEIVCPLHRGAFPIASLLARPSTIRLREDQAVSA